MKSPTDLKAFRSAGGGIRPLSGNTPSPPLLLWRRLLSMTSATGWEVISQGIVPLPTGAAVRSARGYL